MRSTHVALELSELWCASVQNWRAELCRPGYFRVFLLGMHRCRLDNI